MNSKNVKDIRKQLRNVAQELLPDVLKQELFTAMSEQIEKNLREIFGARLEGINDSIMSQLKQMDERSKDLQQFMLNQVQAELGKTAPKAEVDQTLPESANLSVTAESTENTQPQS